MATGDTMVRKELKYMTIKNILVDLALVLIFSIGILVSGLSLMPVQAQVTAPNSCLDPDFATRFNTLYRSWNIGAIDHFYSNDVTETATGYNSETPVGHLMYQQELGTVPLYRYYSPSLTDHFYSTSNVTPNGYNNEGIIGYIFVTPVSGSIPLYRSYRHLAGPLANGDHLYTSSSVERDSAAFVGYSFEGIEGYVCPM